MQVGSVHSTAIRQIAHARDETRERNRDASQTREKVAPPAPREGTGKVVDKTA